MGRKKYNFFSKKDPGENLGYFFTKKSLKIMKAKYEDIIYFEFAQVLYC